MTTKPRFKIDYDGGFYLPFALFFYELSWWGGKWKRLASFETTDKAKQYYELIKDLPEYLP